MASLKLHEAFRILRERHGITDMKVGLPELEIIEDSADLCSVYSYRDFFFCVDADGNVLGGREEFDRKLKLLPARRQKVPA